MFAAKRANFFTRIEAEFYNNQLNIALLRQKLSIGFGTIINLQVCLTGEINSGKQNYLFGGKTIKDLKVRCKSQIKK